MRKLLCSLLFLSLAASPTFAGLTFVRSNGITLTGADGINYVSPAGITLTGADGLLAARSSGITLTGADGIALTGADGITLTGADGATYTGPNGITLTGADGITLTGADGITLTGADGITLTGADGTQYRADSIVLREPNGITLTGADGITLTGADGITLTGADGVGQAGSNGITLTGADGITLTGADGITLTGADGITLTGADSAIGFNSTGIAFDLTDPSGITLTGADGITLTGADGITLTGADDVLLSNFDSINVSGIAAQTGIQSLDPELAIALNNATDDSTINAVVVYHQPVTEADLNELRANGINGGTKFRILPMVYISGTKAQIAAISRLASVRSIYGNRTLTFNTDPYFKRTEIERVSSDPDLRNRNSGIPASGRGVTVAVLDTGINSQHSDLAGRVVQNVRLADTQSVPTTFISPVPVENIPNTDPVAGHGTFVAGIIAGSGVNSGGKYAGVAPGAKLLGLSAGDANLTGVLSGFDYLLEKGSLYNTKVVNCSFSANTVYDVNDPVNVASKMLTERGVSVVFSAGNTGSGNGTLNPYAQAPWVISVGATDQNGRLASFSSRGSFGGPNQQPSLVAPGVNVASLRSVATSTSIMGWGAADAQRLTPGEMPFYTTGSGTSFSAPQVAGAIALINEANPSLPPAEIKDILSRTATPLPKYFAHESGAGMLNTHAAVIEAAFPHRRMGSFRATLSANPIRFTTATTQTFTETVYPNLARFVDVSIPTNVVQASIGISWGLSANDLGLRLYNSENAVVGESNYLNLSGLTGRREEMVLRKPGSQTLRSQIYHSFAVGTAQNVYGAVEITSVDYPNLADLNGLSYDSVAQIEKSMLANIMPPLGRTFRPSSPASRFDLAAALVRAGLVSQFVAGSPIYTDVTDGASRNVVESVQTNTAGRFIYDAVPGGRFYMDQKASKLVAAVAFVKAAQLESTASSATLPPNVLDASSIPTNLRGYVAVALQQGFLTLDGNDFNANRGITRLELAKAINSIIQ